MSQENKDDDLSQNFAFSIDAINNMANGKNPDGTSNSAADVVNLEESAKYQDPRKKNLENFSNVTDALSTALTGLTAIAKSDKTRENLTTAANTGRKMVGGLLGGLGNIRAKLENHFDTMMDEAQSNTEAIRTAGNFNPNLDKMLDEQMRDTQEAFNQIQKDTNAKLSEDLTRSLEESQKKLQRLKGLNNPQAQVKKVEVPVSTPSSTPTATTVPTANAEQVNVPQQSTELKKDPNAPADAPVEVKKLGRKDIKGLDVKLNDVVFGQTEAIEEIVEVLKSAVLGLSPNKDKPKGCYLFLGPSGVGKTETVQQIARLLNIPLHSYDMGEFSASNDIKKLIGAPAGYTGYEDGGILTNAVLKEPVSIVLFDEIEKADAEINKILLAMLDKGVVTDNRGNKAQFKETMFFATSNLGAEVEYRTDLSDEEKFEYRMEIVKEKIPPEIINRYDSIIQFKSINELVFKLVAKKFLKVMTENFKESQGIELDYTDKLLDFAAKEAFDPAMGGRPARRFIDKIVSKGIVDLIFDDEDGDALDGYQKLTMDVNKEGLITFIDTNATEEDKKVVATLKNTKELVARFKKAKFSKNDEEITDDANVTPTTEQVVAQEAANLPEVTEPISIDAVAQEDKKVTTKKAKAKNQVEPEFETKPAPARKTSRKM
jgi:ATP-dependent protease Clp ATPase subunit